MYSLSDPPLSSVVTPFALLGNLRFSWVFWFANQNDNLFTVFIVYWLALL